jgi:hypothetical protein
VNVPAISTAAGSCVWPSGSRQRKIFVKVSLRSTGGFAPVGTFNAAAPLFCGGFFRKALPKS